MTITLYEIGQEMVEVIQQLEEMGADEQQIKDTLASMDITDRFEEKAASVAAYIKNLEAEAEAYKKEKERLQKLQKETENKINNMKNYLDYWMKMAGVRQVKHGVHEIKYRKGSEVVEIVDEAKIPKEYFIAQEPKLMSKTDLKRLLKQGKVIEGIRLVRNPDSLQIK